MSVGKLVYLLVGLHLDVGRSRLGIGPPFGLERLLGAGCREAAALHSVSYLVRSGNAMCKISGGRTRDCVILLDEIK